MATKSKMVLGILLAVLVVIGGWVYFNDNKGDMGQGSPAASATSGQTDGQTGSSTSAAGGSVSNSNDASDASINSDLGNIDAQMNGLNTDSNGAASASSSNQ